MKKLLSIILSMLCLSFPLSMVSYANDTISILTEDIIEVDYAPDNFIPVEDPLRDFVPPNMDFLTQQTVTRSATKVLYVNEPCDQSWQNKYPNNWMWQAHRVVIESDHILEDRIGVQFFQKVKNIGIDLRLVLRINWLRSPRNGG